MTLNGTRVSIPAQSICHARPLDLSQRSSGVRARPEHANRMCFVSPCLSVEELRSASWLFIITNRRSLTRRQRLLYVHITLICRRVSTRNLIREVLCPASVDEDIQQLTYSKVIYLILPTYSLYDLLRRSRSSEFVTVEENAALAYNDPRRALVAQDQRPDSDMRSV